MILRRRKPLVYAGFGRGLMILGRHALTSSWFRKNPLKSRPWEPHWQAVFGTFHNCPLD